MAAAYSDQTLITQVAGKHADHAHFGDVVSGRPTSSATLPSLVVRMLRHGEIYDGARVLDVGTGSGYSAALLSRLLGDGRVTSIDVDPYPVEAAAARLDAIGLHPKLVACDATGPLPGEFDRIVSMVSVRPIPPSWLAALKPGGRLVTVIANTSLIVTAVKTADGKAVGHIARDWAMFMPTRSGGDYPPRSHELFDLAREQRGEQVSRGRFPVVDTGGAWELRSMLEVITSGGIEHDFEG
ncbi:methyltransferase domain-containing protein [Nonomuraea purpurea]|uniref:Protein-L-isoaspartate O-methyltransferase n=1 Tax=Nonomuraea purpurea TaxID=1849276 RepID=A0ABV8G1E3_9ACTN